MIFDDIGSVSMGFARLDRQQLALIVPLVERRVLIKSFIALQANEARVIRPSQSQRNLGLPDARLAFQQ